MLCRLRQACAKFVTAVYNFNKPSQKQKQFHNRSNVVFPSKLLSGCSKCGLREERTTNSCNKTLQHNCLIYQLTSQIFASVDTLRTKELARHFKIWQTRFSKHLLIYLSTGFSNIHNAKFECRLHWERIPRLPVA